VEEMHDEKQHSLFLITVKLMKMKRTDRKDEMREHFVRRKWWEEIT